MMHSVYTVKNSQHQHTLMKPGIKSQQLVYSFIHSFIHSIGM